MLRSLRLRGLGVIDDAEVQFGPGLNVITGETGAGKTMVISGLGLLLGARADVQLVRTGHAVAVVEGEVQVGVDHPAAQRVLEAGGEVDEGLLLARSVSAAGRSRAHVGGRAAPAGVLVDVGEHLVAVHGQADQWRLRDTEHHRLMLDAVGGGPVRIAREAYEADFDRWHCAQTQLSDVVQASTERTREAQMLRTALAEIGQVAPALGEENDLLAEAERLGHADMLRTAAASAHAALVSDDSSTGAATDVLAHCVQALRAAGEHDSSLLEVADRLAEASIIAADAAADLARYAESVESDPDRLAWVQQRRAQLSTLLRHYGADTAEVLAWVDRASTRLAELDTSKGRIAELESEVAEARRQLATSASALSAARSVAAERLQRVVGEELRQLAMGSAVVSVALTPRPPAHVPRRTGPDDIEICLAAHAGSPARSIARSASGGELSRVMLALEIACATDPVPTYVFDEVDAGVGGSAAVELGARLAQLARSAQVLVVTHLGQVAAYADRHLVVDKTSTGPVTSAAVHAVQGMDREAELARMLGGDAASPEARQHARALIARHHSRG
ncbi:MAG TPA: DNA repair protein RecN [Ornithinimicrobium sp.]|uniref:DNA repair protein RecN n=1 Tax=Ornithinimicrobium sp. TaxID=1977084 RepID=UPI002B4629DD|nr:DNA repair protein RecN [Ornithinimicrobium sp.]HKJ11733.1 DNA repair protein RecN [Ornithinimicrobium sp.]